MKKLPWESYDSDDLTNLADSAARLQLDINR